MLDIVSSKAAKVMLLISHIVSLVFLLAIAYFGIFYLELVIELEEMSIDLGIPMWIPYLAIPVAFTLASYRVAEKIIEIVKTPHEKVLGQSEAEQIMAYMGVEKNSFKDISKDKEELKNIVDEANRKSGGLL